MVAENMEQTLDTFFGILLSLQPASRPEQWHDLTTPLAEDCIVYPMSMREHLHPGRGHVGAIDAFKASINEAQLVERQVISQTTDIEKRRIICEMENHLLVSG